MNENDKRSEASDPPLDSLPFVLNSSSPYDDDPEDVEQETYGFPYFLAMARSFCRGVTDADLQDIAQEAWVSYSRISEKGDIDNPKAYIAKTIRNKFKDHLRKEKQQSHLPIISLSAFADNPDLELAALSHQGLINSTNQLDDQLEKIDFLNNLAVVLSKVAPRQRRVVICTLLDKVDDPLSFKQALKSNHIDASEMCWPSNKAEKRLLQASLPAARRTLARLMHIDLCQYQRRKRCSHLPTPDEKTAV